MPIVSENYIIEKAKELPAVSPSVFEMIKIIDDFDTPKSDIVYLASVDQVLCASIFKFVNSAALGFGRRVDTIEEAVDIIGLNHLKRLAINVSAKQVFADDKHWHNSLFTALGSYDIAKKAKKTEEFSNNLYIAGLLSSCGVLVLKNFFKKEYLEVESQADIFARLEAEQNIFGLNHIKLAVEILSQWNVPETIVKIIEPCHQPDDKNYDERSAVLSLVDEILNKVDIEKKDDIANDKIIRDILPQKKYSQISIDSVDLSIESIKQIHDKAREYQQL